MKARLVTSLCGLFGAMSALAQTPLGTSLTYQGRLENGGTPANGLHDMRFQLFTALSGGSQVGSTICRDGVNVVDGLFTVSLDFGAAYDGNQRFLAVAVRPDSTAGNCATGAYTSLSPRQGLTAAPYALKVPGIDGNSLNAADGSPVDAVVVDNDGNVGIGTTNTTSLLTVGSPSIRGTLNVVGSTSVIPVSTLTDSRSGGRQYSFYGGLNGLGCLDVFDQTAAATRLTINSAGNVGIGTTTPAAKLDVVGTTRTQVLEIVGADLAEKFPASEKLEPGMVVAIDAHNAGKLCLARGAYNRCVAGIVSGASDFKVGAVLGNLPGHEDAPPIALSGRVYVHCDASSGAIEPGDLLTSSDTPGHAMNAADRERSHGAVIGKAMTGLACGERGMVLVLVNLQ